MTDDRINPSYRTGEVIFSVILYKILKTRWEVENSIFNNLKNEVSLGHCFVHDGNAVEGILYMLFIGSNLLQLFRSRRIRNQISVQKELIRSDIPQ